MSFSLESSEFADVKNTWYDIAEDYIGNNFIIFSKPNYIEIFATDMYNYIITIAREEEWENDDLMDELEEIIYDFCREFLEEYSIPLRENSPYSTITFTENEIDEALMTINSFPVQRQRSAEWYSVRYNMFSASNLGKLFGSNAQYNSLIYEKCKGLDVQKAEFVDLLSPNARNWGIRYEPVSAMLYEDINKTKINTNYGCIKHKTLPIGASPDGIVNDKTSRKYGNMVEIKNIYNRDINGIPSEDYWIQMQIQLEVCQLERCDFVETRFKEYPNFEMYIKDEITEYKGVILFFMTKDSNVSESHYIYMPLNTTDIESWIDNKVCSLRDTHILYDRFYWYLDEYSSVEVERNMEWFKAATPVICEAWDIVLKERVEGFEHRAPQKKNKTVVVTSQIENTNCIPNKVQLIKLN